MSRFTFQALELHDADGRAILGTLVGVFRGIYCGPQACDYVSNTIGPEYKAVRWTLFENPTTATRQWERGADGKVREVTAPTDLRAHPLTFADRTVQARAAVVSCIDRVLHDEWKAPVLALPPPTCEHCESIVDVQLEDSRTLYTLADGSGIDTIANRDLSLCRGCAVEHHDHWNAMWQEYYDSRGC